MSESVSGHCSARQAGPFSDAVNGGGKTPVPGSAYKAGAARKTASCLRWLFPVLEAASRSSRAEPKEVGPPIAEPDMATVLSALRNARGNVKQAAMALGISRQRLYRMLDEAEDVDLTKLRGGGESP